MPFDIDDNFFDSGTFTFNEERAEAYEANLLKQFEESPEAKALLQSGVLDELSWAEVFLDFVIFDEYVMLRYVRQSDLRDILYQMFPQNIMVSPDEASQIVAELRAFWEFLKREYELESADKLLKVLNEKNIVKRLERELGDSTKYGMAKNIFMPGIEAGLDVSDEAAVKAYVEDYNRKIQAETEAIQNAPISDKVLKKRDEIIDLVTDVCQEHLNQEYADLATKMATIIAQVKPNSPFEKAKAKSWAAGIVYALGQVNFLFDKNTEPHMRADQLVKLFGVSQQTASNKASQIREGMGLIPFDPEWTLASNQERSPWNALQDVFSNIMGSPLDFLSVMDDDFDSEDYGYDEDDSDDPPNLLHFPGEKKK